MRRNILSLFVMLNLLITQAEAQFVNHYGLKLGTSAATQTWEYGSSTDPQTRTRWGIDAGIFVEWFDTPVFSLCSEVHFVQKGLRYDIPITTQQYPNGTGEFIVVRPRLDYLSIPLLAKLRLDFQSFTPYLLIGPRFDILLSKDGDRWFNAFFDKFKSADFGGTIALGGSTALIPGLLTGIEIRYSPSFQRGYSDSFQTFTNKSFEFLLTIGS